MVKKLMQQNLNKDLAQVFFQILPGQPVALSAIFLS